MKDGQLPVPLNWPDLYYLAPELIVSAMFILLVAVDLLLPSRSGRRMIGWLALAGLGSAIGVIIYDLSKRFSSSETAQSIELLGATYRVDDFGEWMKLIIVLAVMLILLLGIGSYRQEQYVTAKGEYYYMLLPAALGAMMLVSSGNLITLYVALELLGISSYVLIGLRRKHALAAEAAFKYVVTGSIASAFILFGLSYLYGVTGSVELLAMQEAMPMALQQYEAFVYTGFAFMLIGIFIKVAAAPFHAWAPDVYQGASVPVAAFLSVVAKAAVLGFALRILYAVLLQAGYGLSSTAEQDIFEIVLIIAAIAMLVGTIGALRQWNVKRLLAYSGVANAGFLLVPIGISISLVHSNNLNAFIFYLVAYMLMNVGAFAVLTVVSEAAGHNELRGFAGMYYRAPWTAAAMILIILSLAGLPVSGGFFGKLFILLGAASVKAYWLLAIMVLSSVISYYVYFGIIRQMFMRSAGATEQRAAEKHNGRENVQADGCIHIPVTTGIVIWFCAAGSLLLGLFPGALMAIIDPIVQIYFDLRVNM